MLLTQKRIGALSRINRFAGWTTRGYCVLEHSLIGAHMLAETGHNVGYQRAFLIHDLHETAFGGDITKPVKSKYMPVEYHEDVRAWDRELCGDADVSFNDLYSDVTKWADAVMLAAETRTVSTVDWLAPIPEGAAQEVSFCMRRIRGRMYRNGRDQQAFWQMFGGF